MADIDLERKSGGSSWIWALLGLVLLAGLAWWFWPDGDDVALAPGDDVETVQEAEPAGPEAGPGEPGTDPAIPIEQIVANPDQWIDRPLPNGRYEVEQEITDRGFWINHQGGERIFAIVIDQPEEQPIDINAGQTLAIQEATIRSPDYLDEIPGDPLEADTERIARDQQVIVVVDERNIRIVREAMR